jgi:hypothetical protein
MLGENFLEQVGGIIPERWADLDRNGGRHHLGIVGGFRPESARLGYGSPYNSRFTPGSASTTHPRYQSASGSFSRAAARCSPARL